MKTKYLLLLLSIGVLFVAACQPGTGLAGKAYQVGECDRMPVDSCTSDANGVNFQFGGNSYSGNFPSNWCNSDGTGQHQFSCLDAVTLQHCTLACDFGEECSGQAGQCVAVAASAVCGNRVVETGEACDDGNTVSGDGCSKMCTIEVDPCAGVSCDPGQRCFQGTCFVYHNTLCKYGQSPKPDVSGISTAGTADIIRVGETFSVGDSVYRYDASDAVTSIYDPAPTPEDGAEIVERATLMPKDASKALSLPLRAWKRYGLWQGYGSPISGWSVGFQMDDAAGTTYYFVNMSSAHKLPDGTSANDFKVSLSCQVCPTDWKGGCDRYSVGNKKVICVNPDGTTQESYCDDGTRCAGPSYPKVGVVTCSSY